MKQTEFDTILNAARALEDSALAAYLELTSDMTDIDFSGWSYEKKCAYGDPIRYQLAADLRNLLRNS